ncbi:class I adenylate-forming enzyme family protein [Parvibaculum sp.]|uniref:class I adenylate-forming enzyme family protein n=1 Tax=Parvibaculum sp. TaxID=2024848 RepID=UPI002C13B2C0|nr:class I adenylate-forming enzyme family protein [Parvibaculum sp.]HUD52716.1 class I adenylate-forming enzyme family protein [Parvibaculum sp.]
MADTSWPAMSIADANRILTAPGMPFEMETLTIRGIPTRVYKNAPPHLRFIFEAGRAHGARDFIVYEGERLSFENHYRAAVAFGRVLADKYGVRKGDRVTIAMRNFPEWSIAFWAAAALGAVIVPINAWGTGPELEYCITDSGSKVAVIDGERLDRLKPHLANLNLAGLVTVRTPRELLDGAEAFEDLIGKPADYAKLSDAALPDPGLLPEDDATIFYTSGTTGKPKGALGTQRNILTNLISAAYAPARAYLRRGEQPPQSDPNAPQRSMLLSVPLFHATGCHSILVPMYAGGGKLVIMHKWQPERALELIEQEKIQAFGGVPAMVWQVLESPDFAKYDTSSVESVSYGGAPSAPDLVQRIKQQFPKVHPGNGYGLTETSSITTQNSAEDYVNRPESAGPAVPVCDLKVVDENGKDVPTGQVGELWIKGPNVVKGYWNKPEATQAAITDGWLHSGDLVRIDEEGFVFILDRAKDMLIRGGENIYCVEVEGALYAHPAVMDAAVVGIPHKVLGEEVGAIVQVAPGKDVTEEELKAHVGKLLAAFKVPIRIEIRHEPLPRNANGKILKTVLREDIKKFVGQSAA